MEKLHAAAAAAGITPTQVVLPKIGEIESVEHWHREIRDLYVRARIGDLRPFEAEFFRKIADSGISACEKKEARDSEKRLQALFEKAIERGVVSRDALPLMFDAMRPKDVDDRSVRKGAAR